MLQFILFIAIKIGILETLSSKYKFIAFSFRFPNKESRIWMEVSHSFSVWRVLCSQYESTPRHKFSQCQTLPCAKTYREPLSYPEIYRNKAVIQAIQSYKTAQVRMCIYARLSTRWMRYYIVWLDSRLLFIRGVLLADHKSETWYPCEINQINRPIKLFYCENFFASIDSHFFLFLIWGEKSYTNGVVEHMLAIDFFILFNSNFLFLKWIHNIL